MHGAKPPVPAGASAIAVLVPGSGSQVTGTVKFTQVADGVRVEADVQGLTPGAHGFHVHEKGDLSKPDLTSAGGHFNPEGHPHAARTATERHAGDLGNLEAGPDGHALVDFVDPKLQLTGPHAIIGRAVIIHAKADDLKSQPTGDAGGRVAGGVIGLVSEK
ncbi:superoxide dismutase family protein [Opitutus sp. ER46]|nr:superoxide dismutase family protein [Opitutus sp. ER46]